MALRILLIPVGTSVGLTTVSLGLVRAMQQQGVKVNFFKPVAQSKVGGKAPERSTEIIKNVTQIEPPTPLSIEHVEDMISNDKRDILLEEIIGLFEQQDSDDSITVIEGLITTDNQSYAVRLNREICNALDASIVLVCAPNNLTGRQLNDKLEIVADSYGGHKSKKVIGCIVNKVNAPLDEAGRIRVELVFVIICFSIDSLTMAEH